MLAVATMSGNELIYPNDVILYSQKICCKVAGNQFIAGVISLPQHLGKISQRDARKMQHHQPLYQTKSLIWKSRLCDASTTVYVVAELDIFLSVV
jgi:hypothetical protein